MKNKLVLDLQIATNSDHNLPSKKQILEWLNVILSPFYQTAEITIRITEESESRELNNTYRNKDYATNVLSFPFESPLNMDIPLLGDLVICKPIVEKEAKIQNKDLLSHWAHLIIHGTLHLMGYDHITEEQAQEMETLEIEIMHKLGFGNPYQDDDEQ